VLAGTERSVGARREEESQLKAEKTYGEVQDYVQRIAERFDWKLVEDAEMLDWLVSGLQTNFNRLGYFNCPCRESQDDARADRDIICPCLYARDADVRQYGYCFCALFFRGDFDQSQPLAQIPERRPTDGAK